MTMMIMATPQSQVLTVQAFSTLTLPASTLVATLFCRSLTADTSEHPTTRHIATYMYALKTSSTEMLQPAL